MSLQITICPECRSSFNFNRSTLRSTNGRVRCGACLAVFKASEHFFESEAQSEISKNGSVFVSEEPIDYFNPLDFLSLDELNGSDETCGDESKIRK